MKKLKENAKKLKIYLPALFLSLKHEKTPFFGKALAVITVMYALSPIDLIPDFIPVLGYLDDLLLLPLLIAATIKLIPKDVLDECLEKSENMWKDGKPKKWYYAIPIVLFYLLLLYLLIKLIFFH